MMTFWTILGSMLGGGVISTIVQTMFNYFVKNKEINVSAGNLYLQNLETRMKEQDERTHKCEEERAELRARVTSLEDMIQNLKETIARVERRQIAAVIVCDENGFIIEWSSGATALLYYTRNEMIGKHLNTLIPAKDRAAHDISYALAVSEKRAPKAVGPRKLHIVARNGETLPVIIHLSGFCVNNHWSYSAEIHLCEEDNAEITKHAAI